ncbi:MAG: fibrobacter succinogenes major paralogous domain-containing protein [Candidatus Saccharibacteria bacterium]
MNKIFLTSKNEPVTLPPTTYKLPSTKPGFTHASPRLRRIKVASPAFTIVELLVVIVVIGILAAITIVSYTGISQKAIVATLQSDLGNASKTIKLYQVEQGQFPTSFDANNCPVPANARYCLKASSGNTFDRTAYAASVNNSTNPQTFTLDVTNTNTTKYRITNNSAPIAVSATPETLADTDPANWLAIGTQVWGKYNLNVGTMVTGVTAQTNNLILEKYCSANTESNCTTYGGLYQWDEAMQYVTTNGAQGICPTGSHIPSDNDWKVLEVQLGMTQVQADAIAWRGTNQGTQLKNGGTSGLNMPLAGLRYTDGSFDTLSSFAYLWSSSESSTSAWERTLYSGYATVYRDTLGKAGGFSVRCLGN